MNIAHDLPRAVGCMPRLATHHISTPQIQWLRLEDRIENEFWLAGVNVFQGDVQLEPGPDSVIIVASVATLHVDSNARKALRLRRKQ